MLHYASDLETYRLHATDGELGKVKNWYIDDVNWIIRYAAVDTRKWLPGRNVVLAPAALAYIDEEKEEIISKHDKETVRNSPPLEESEGFTNEYERSLTGYYGWDPYWYSAELWGQMNTPLTDALTARQPEETPDKIEQISESKEYTLREADEIKDNITVLAGHNKLGVVDDLLIDDENWKVRYLVVRSESNGEETNHFLSPDWLVSADWQKKNLTFDLPPEELEKNAGLRKKRRIQREEEKEIYKRYYKAPYWE